ncbi:hypothetical protein [Alcanivorax sp.]|nr:hypothetical protein [Alcanivorax sp.]
MGIAVLSVTCSQACEDFVNSGVIHVLRSLASLSYPALPGYVRRFFANLLHSSPADELTDRVLRMDCSSAVKNSYLVLMTSLMAACGGGGGSSEAGPSNSPDNNNDNGNNEIVALERVAAASFGSEEDVVLLAPGSLMDETHLPLSRMALNLNEALNVDMTGADRDDQSQACEGGGEHVVTDRSDDDVASPFSGALHDVIESDDRNCFSSDTVAGSGRADGVRRIGYPVSGIGGGNFFAETDFIGFEHSGMSLDSPFSVSQSFDDDTVIFSRYWYGFIHLRRDSADEDYGSAGGELEQYSVVGTMAIDGDGSGTGTTQLGNSEQQRFWLEYGIDGDMTFEEGHIERYQGRYGYSTNVLPESCPQGSFHVETVQDLYVKQVAEDEGLLDKADEVSSGSLTMVDDAGNQAAVSYDAGAETLTVTLNDNAPKAFTYSQIEALMTQRCGGF